MVSADRNARDDREPEGFGSALIDEAARRDAALGDVDWAAVPDGAVRGSFAAPSGPLTTLSMGTPGSPRVLLVPGATGSKEDFVLMLPELAGAGYFVQSYDIAGQYDSAAAGPEHLTPPRAHYDYDLFVDDLLAVLDAVEGPAHVVGYSFAAIIAQLAYTRCPAKFRSLTLLSCPPEPGQSFRGIQRIGRFSRWASPRIGAAVMIWGIRANVIHVRPNRIRFVKHRFRFTRRSSVADIFGLLQHAPDVRAALGAASLPKFVAVGEHDLWPLALHRNFAQSVGARIAVYRGGHSPSETSPYQISRDLIALYGSV
ncbi:MULTISPECIES: alpha/beta fold hydrolase [unclassified Arthrobacter]|uniref:alpha/beta fold hydrolase n=1 Tax=unclassified Arthrobacter TaxID=235627 RepID=UPI002E0714EF|nr:MULTISPECIES: alpha/beta hydrolase [unclassified Arthrobacter]MEC5192505.1 pimeloyl-ACP methyl ester carboxylesterase [Arthrobacter sp. MP_M4]MEC5203989.1 pimeloyl-ACP methyl ester carboxylesterase [Arthrobacter sp. MP_M7]